MQLAVVIVSWNTRELTLNAIRTVREDLQQSGLQSYKIWVVDNASSDNSADAVKMQFPDVKLIENRENIGFGPANNAALRAMGFGKSKVALETLPEAVYLLNSDTITHTGATRELFDQLMTLPKAGVVGARLTYGDGAFQHSAFGLPGLAQLWIDLLPTPGRLRQSRLNGRYSRRLYESYTPFKVGHPLGATMMLKREVIQQVGMFDEDFFMYAEEVDWCWRIHKAGWNIYCVPTAHVIHLEGQSTKQVKPRSLQNLWESRMRLFRKHYPLPKRVLAKLILRLGMRYKIQQTHEALQYHQISAKERDALVDVYRKISSL